MKRMGVLAIMGCAAVALILGTALAGERPSVTMQKQSAASVSPAVGPALWLEGCYRCHRPWGHVGETPDSPFVPTEWNPDTTGTQRLRVRNISDHLEPTQQHPAPARK